MTWKGNAMRLIPGDLAPSIATQTLSGDLLRLPDAQHGLTHVQFRRFAGCPVCNFHLMMMSRRHDEIRAAGIRQVVIFHSSREDMLSYQSQLPFICVPDPGKALYRAYGVETSAAALLNPMILWKGLRWILASRRFYKRAENGILGLPADFLIGRDGTVLARHYGSDADDQWDADELLRQAGLVSEPASGATCEPGR
jgi:peroxiredoxin